MKINLKFKNPDALYEAIKDLNEETQEEVREICSNWLKYGEYIEIEIDTEKDTATVVRP